MTKTITTLKDNPMLRMGSVAFLAGIVVVVASTMVHPSGPDLMDNPAIFAVYAEDETWIAAHFGQLAGIMLIYAGGFVALHPLFARSESGTVSTLAWIGLATAIMTAGTFGILQAVDGIALKMAVDSWYAAPEGSVEKDIYFGVAEGLRWTEAGLQSIYRILQGAVGIIIGTAIMKSGLFSRWIGALGIFAGFAALIAGVVVGYVMFSSVRDPIADVATASTFAWLAILGAFMWRKSMARRMVTA
jgi:hypothetical protein